MDCREVAPWLTLRPESAAAQAALELHLRTCPACATRAQHAAALDRTLQSALLVDPPPALTNRLLSLAREAAASRVAEAAQAPSRHLSPGEQVGARALPSTIPARNVGAAVAASYPRGRREQIAALAVIAALALGLWTLLNTDPILSAAAFVWGIAISLQAILSSPAGRLLANPGETIAPLLPVVAAFLLAGVLAHEAGRPPRPSRDPTPSL